MRSYTGDITAAIDRRREEIWELSRKSEAKRS